jgi:hypothetical protein
MRELFVSYGIVASIIDASYSYYRSLPVGYEVYLVTTGCIAQCAINELADITDFEENHKDYCKAEVGSKDDALALGSYFMKPLLDISSIGTLPKESIEFVLGVTSELNPSQSIETVSDPIPEGCVLHLLAARASCNPVEDVNRIRNSLMVELIYREVWEGETYDHLFGKSYLLLECSVDFPASSRCWDGTEMIGDGINTVFVIRRTVTGNVEAQDTMVAVRGYYM